MGGGLCSVDIYRCSSGLSGVDIFRCSTVFCRVDNSRLSSDPSSKGNNIEVKQKQCESFYNGVFFDIKGSKDVC